MKSIFLAAILILATTSFTFGQKKVAHVVLFKLKQGISKEDPRFVACLETMKTLPQKIPQIQEFSCGKNFSDRPVAFEAGLYSTFASRADLQTYLNHPAHKEAANALKEIADWNIADYEIP